MKFEDLTPDRMPLAKVKTMTDERFEKDIRDLMAEQSRLAVEIEELQQRIPPDTKQIAALKQTHREKVREVIRLLYMPLKEALGGMQPKMDDAGVQYTEMVHDFFLKLFEGKVQTNDSMRTFHDLKKFVATVLLNQMLDHLRIATNRRRIESAIAPIAEQKQRYFEERYRTSFLDFLERIELWEDGDDGELHLAARAMLLHYVAGEKWNVIEKQLGISTERLTKLRQLAAREFRQK